MKEPQVTVGIMSERQIRFVFNGTYLANGVPVSGEHEAHTDGKQIFWNGNRYTRIVFTPEKEDYSFCLKEVTIGVKFHWERKEDQTFKGNLNLIVENGLITAINALSVEDYLLSVISSEMSATASLELLKSHAVISRSWLLAQIRKNKELAGKKPDSLIRTDKELIHWYGGKTISTSTYVPTIIVNVIKASLGPVPKLSHKPYKLRTEKFSHTMAKYAMPAFQNAAEASWKNFPLAGKI